MQQHFNEQIDAKRRENSIIHLLYTLQRWIFRLYLSIVGLLVLVLISGFIAMKTSWGSLILSGTLPWKFILPAALVIGFCFIFTDTFVQGKEERWFRRYGTEVMATVTDFREIHNSRWRRFFLSGNEFLVILYWTSPETEQVYEYTRRVRDSNLPAKGALLPVIIDYTNPNAYWREDYKHTVL
ncbi:hypothetical protein [Dictyobacter arantiisoli]|uniref:Uncharacterized protein n=1 Tax=Dictyobacter arantiisoli TaxID=2014874 RepID=A0A5A5TKP6_9CHLR|nr:hypothetical protein [Dictyobacter arantiisoli]GCF11808.1 hypothetical protein KDI_53720 [Dictyobacter arantiisoli]